MCCFSGSVQSVDNTRIFARWLPGREGGHFRQSLVYQMNFRAKKELAMILPVPAARGAGEDAMKFIDLEHEADFFAKLNECYPIDVIPMAYAETSSRSFGGREKLKVEKVGSFVASYVPEIADFSRLDKRFRLPEGTWNRLPQYRNYSFAVFQLRPEATTVHPMAFTFPRAEPERGIFFPTVHIHDGKVHEMEDFDHTLYCQIPPNARTPAGWEESPKHPASVTKSGYQGLLERKAHLYRRTFFGKFKNSDTWA